jgi:redox-sensitive bicupin YhaK (pirin superfamily)
MIDVIKAKERYFSDFGWLKTYWLFSFSNYFDPHNIQFGALRVFNDDIVEPGTGFPTHPHEEMEIITIVLKGEMIFIRSGSTRTRPALNPHTTNGRMNRSNGKILCCRSPPARTCRML